jgi:hypothetical protein
MATPGRIGGGRGTAAAGICGDWASLIVGAAELPDWQPASTTINKPAQDRTVIDSSLEIRAKTSHVQHLAE